MPLWERQSSIQLESPTVQELNAHSHRRQGINLTTLFSKSVIFSFILKPVQFFTNIFACITYRRQMSLFLRCIFFLFWQLLILLFSRVSPLILNDIYLYCVVTYIYSLLIDKDLFEFRNVFSCALLCVSFIPVLLLFFSVSHVYSCNYIVNCE